MPTFGDVPTRRAVRRLPLGDRTELVVDLFSGEPRVRTLELVVGGAGRDRRLVREYRGHVDRDEGFGPGWSLEAGAGLVVDQGRGPDLEPVAVTGADAGVATLHRDPDGRITKITDPAGAQAASFGYDASGRLVRHGDATGAETTFAWDGEGRLVRVTPPHDGPVLLGYEGASVSSLGWEGPDGPVAIGFAYGSGRTTVTGPAGHATVYAFDGAGRPVAVTDPLGNTSEQEWDARGLPTRSSDATGAALLRSYDDAGRLVSVRLPTSAVASFRYGDPAHPALPSAVRDPAGNELLLERDGAGRVTVARVPSRENPVDTRAYDPGHGRISTLTDGNGATTAFRHDAAGRLVEVAPPAPLGATAYRYDVLGRLSHVTDGNGRTLGRGYDAAGRLNEVTDEESGTALLSLSHDGLGRVVRRSGPGWSHAFEWIRTAGGDRPASVRRTDGDGSEELRAGYDAEGLLTSLETPGGTTLYGHDAAGRTASVTTPAGGTAVFAHDAAGRLVSVDFGPAVQEIAYDASGRRTRLTVRGHASGETLLSVEYGYSSGGGADDDVLRHTIEDGEFTGYAYDGLKRLVRAGETEFAYDAANHLVRLGDVRFTLNPAGQVKVFGRTTFDYDGAGNFTEEQNPTGSFAYSPTHQTLSGVFGGQRVVDIAYDGLGQETPRRITETTVDGRTVTHVLTHGPLGVVRVTDDGVPTDFVRAPDGSLLAVVTSDGRTHWAVTDQRGSVLALVDGEGRLAARYRYTPHGAVTATGPAASANPFRYRGAYQLLRSAHVLDHHLYNGFWGRFTQPDPTGRQYAPYTFSDNDPLGGGTGTGTSFWRVLARPHLPAEEAFLGSHPSSRDGLGPAGAARFTGAGAVPGGPPLIAGEPPSTVL
ncbi:RHS repeat protein [Streptomyces sp. NPDC096339]|uniref:RHS repeat protein n=1 Tax=Streptomyces sp. NPDC096339 TaxID=3366086 RepID=UPI00381AB224